MNIKWAYYFIIALYAILIILRVINYLNNKAYIKENTNIKKAFSIKKDFFTTVACICIVVTIGINIATLIGSGELNLDSIIVTVLVMGFTYLNSFSWILFSEENKTVQFVGYTLGKGDVESIKIKEGNRRNIINMTFNREIESYNYTKFAVFGAEKEKLTQLLAGLKSEN